MVVFSLRSFSYFLVLFTSTPSYFFFSVCRGCLVSFVVVIDCGVGTCIYQFPCRRAASLSVLLRFVGALLAKIIVYCRVLIKLFRTYLSYSRNFFPCSNTVPIAIIFLFFILSLPFLLLVPYVADVIVCFP